MFYEMTSEDSNKPAKYKNDKQSDCKNAFKSQNFSIYLFLSTCQRKNCKKVTKAVGCLNGSEPTH